MRFISPAEILRRLHYFAFRDRHTAQLEEEVRLHLALRAERLQGGGLTPDAARFAAIRKFGNITHHRERSRDMWGLASLDQLGADCRFAFRRLRNRPGFSLSVVAVAALGIGATTAVFSAVDAAMLRPLPFPRPAELVTLTDVNIPSQRDLGSGGRRSINILDVVAMPQLFAAVAGFGSGGLNIDDPQHPRRVQVGVVTDRFFATLGVSPRTGRTFTPDEGRPGGPKAVILSDGLWRAQFGAVDVLGKSLMLNGQSYAIVGVMPPGFGFPGESDLWIPLTYPRTMATFGAFRGYVPSQVFARLAPGVTVPLASRQLQARWEHGLAPNDPGKTIPMVDQALDDVRARGAVVPLQRDLVGGDRRKALFILIGATALLLLIACANVANLLLSDATTRTREIALRGILGATYGRVVRQLLAESMLLALAGAAAGLILAPTTLGVLRSLMPVDLASASPVHVDLRVLGFATALALVTGVVFGLWPALGAAKVDSSEAIKSGGSHGATAGRMGSTRRLFVTVELALTVMLLVGSGLMLKSFHRLMTQSIGMNPEQVGTLEITFGITSTPESELRFMHGVIDHLAADPGIVAAGIVNNVPLRREGGYGISVEAEGMPKPKGTYATYLLATGGYFKAMGISMLRGRTFTADDDTIGERTVIINSAMAKKWWPGTDALGRRLHFSDSKRQYTVVGIVADVRDRSLTAEPVSQMYFSMDDQGGLGNIGVVARSTLPPAVLLARLTQAVHVVDPGQAVFNLRMMETAISASEAPRRTNTLLIAIFGAVALLLSVFGVYAVVSYGVARRAREFGIRAALGANRADILSLVGREMSIVVLAGLALGLGGAWALSRVLSSMLYGVEVHDVAVFVAVPVVLLVPAMIATLVPSLRAMRVSPTEVMRAE